LFENGEHWKALVAGDWESIGYADPGEWRREVVAASNDLLARRTGERIVVVAHGGTINAIVADLLGLERTFFFEAGYTSISRLGKSWQGEGYHVVSLNEMSHLDSSRRTLDPL
jgi:broad specificity phosphatase PhoE